MKEFIEKLIKRLNEKSKWVAYGNRDRDIGMTHKVVPFSDISDIVNELAEEYKGGWISVKDKLPTETGKYLVTVKNLTGYWILKNNVFVCDYQFDDFIFQGWEDNKVIAWQPLPQPYKEGSE